MASLPSGIDSTGPWGGEAGNQFDDGYTASGIRKIVIRASSANVVRLQIEYVKSNGENVVVTHGGSGGTSHEIVLDYPNEVVTTIEGTYGTHPDFGGSHIGILSLGIRTSAGKKHGPYGNSSGTPFSSENAPEIVGFFGRSGALLDSVGGYIKLPSKIDTTGPWGGEAGTQFDDGYTASGIRKIVILASFANVVRLQIEYVKSNGENVTVTHGGTGGTSREIVLDYPNEVVTSIEGTYGTHPDFGGSHIGILSLGIRTSAGKKHGPYGNSSSGTHFSSETAPKIVGFFGRSGALLDSVGGYIKRN